MKLYAFTGALLLCLGLFAFQPTKSLTLTGELQNCTAAQITLYEHDGIKLVPLVEIPVTTNEQKVGTFNMPISVEHGFYFIGQNDKNYKMLILGNEGNVNIKGAFTAFQQAMIESPENIAYQEMSAELGAIQKEFQGLMNQYQAAVNNPALATGLDAKMADVDKKKLALLAKYKKSHPLVHKTVAIQTYLSYQNNKAANESEADYFTANYFKQAGNFKEETWNKVPHMMDMFRQYASTLTMLGIPNKVQITKAQAQLDGIPANSVVAYKSALSGIMLGFMDKNNPAFIHFAKIFVTKYETEDAQIAGFLNNKIASLASFNVGGEAPDFTQNTPEGTPLSLKELRGKVVMIDFWASWCGPCRKENPHVKGLYEKYKGKGFDILGVSLDNSKDRWLKAIEQDGLPWHHISDLGGWKNAAAVMYGVTSIPQTVLVDAEGNIIARNLRGPALDQKLAEIFAGK